MLPKVGICGLGVSGLRILDDAAGELGVARVEGVLAEQEESPNRKQKLGVLRGILILLIEVLLELLIVWWNLIWDFEIRWGHWTLELDGAEGRDFILGG